MRSIVFVFLGLFFAGVSSSNWQYGDESHWSDTCRNGKSQSPINLDGQIVVEKSFEKFVFNNYHIELPTTVKNNGHSVQVNLNVSNPRATVKGGGLTKEYTLDHLHFHWPSEHTLNGHRFPLEVHLVHFASMYGNLQSALGYVDGLAVLGVFYDFSPDDDIEFQPLINVMDNVQRNLNSAKPANKTRVASFLPRDTAGYFRYNGSLTTPDCKEIVTWTIFSNTIPISKQQVKHFESIHSEKGVLKANYRSLQKLEGRPIYQKVSPIPHGAAKSNFEISIAFAVVFLVFLL